MLIALVFMLFVFISPIINADDSDIKFTYIIDGTHLIMPSTDTVINGQKLLIVHNHIILTMKYEYENGTIIKAQKVTTDVIQLQVYDKSHLVLTDSDNNVVMDIHIHTMSVENFFKYVIPISVSQLIIPTLLAFVCAILLVSAFFINKETKLL